MPGSIEALCQASLRTAKDPDGGPYPAYPSGKSWDEASGKTSSWNKFYLNVISGDDFTAQPYCVAIITPVIHYCMGGLETDQNSAVLGADSKHVPAFYAAGEVAGGVHGNNRLGGNSRLDCVVFGRVVGVTCAQYMLGDLSRRLLVEARVRGPKKWPGQSGRKFTSGLRGLRPRGRRSMSTGGRGGDGFRHHQASHPHGWFGE